MKESLRRIFFTLSFVLINSTCYAESTKTSDLDSFTPLENLQPNWVYVQKTGFANELVDSQSVLGFFLTKQTVGTSDGLNRFHVVYAYTEGLLAASYAYQKQIKQAKPRTEDYCVHGSHADYMQYAENIYGFEKWMRDSLAVSTLKIEGTTLLDASIQFMQELAQCKW